MLQRLIGDRIRPIRLPFHAAVLHFSVRVARTDHPTTGYGRVTGAIGSSNGRFASLPALLAWLRAAPEGTVVPCNAILDALENLDEGPVRVADHDVAASPVLVTPEWREKIWTVPAETRLGVSEAAEALGRGRSFIYRRTSAKSCLAKIPHRKLDGGLVFLAGELRSWLASEEELVVATAVAPRLKRRHGRA